MKILYVHQYFMTPDEGGSIRSYYLAKGMVDVGHEVTMITAHKTSYEIKRVDGIEVHYLPVPYDNGFNFFQRIWSFWSFVRLAKKEARKLSKHDLAYVMTTPLTTGFIAMYLKRKLNLPYYFEVGDLWPEAPIQMGIIKNRWLKKWMYSLEKQIYLEARKNIALSPAIKDHIEKINPNTQVDVISNISDCSFFETKYSAGDFSENNKFQVTYCGTLGKANHLEYLVEAAKQSKEAELPVHFNVMGCGSETERLRVCVGQMNNISFYPHSSKQYVKNLLNESDAVYVSFKDVKVLGTGSPNKLFDSLAAGKLTIINFDGWIKHMVKRNKCGFYYNPHSKTDFIRKLKVFLNSTELLKKYQRNGRKAAELYYDKDIQITKLLKILNDE